MLKKTDSLYWQFIVLIRTDDFQTGNLFVLSNMHISQANHSCQLVLKYMAINEEESESHMGWVVYIDMTSFSRLMSQSDKNCLGREYRVTLKTPWIASAAKTNSLWPQVSQMHQVTQWETWELVTCKLTLEVPRDFVGSRRTFWMTSSGQ